MYMCSLYTAIDTILAVCKHSATGQSYEHSNQSVNKIIKG